MLLSQVPSQLPPYFPYFRHFSAVNSFFIAGFKGRDCSVDIDLCSFGLCSEHTVMCVETKGGQNVSCTCQRGEQALNKCWICHAAALTGGK